MRLTTHFELDEFVRSDTATAEGIDNTPTYAIQTNLRALAFFLEKVRVALRDEPMQLTSGYRCPELNRAVNGVSNSQHMSGLAADFVCPAFGPPLVVCQALEDFPGLEYDQLIDESNARGGHWTHISIAAPGTLPRREVWTISPIGTKRGL